MAFIIGKNCIIHPSAVINVKHGFIGDRAVIKNGVIIEGHRVEIGHEAFIDRNSIIGGGSCFDHCAYLKAGDWLHMGWNSQINTARGVDIGNEFGCGIETKIFTHGAYIDSYALGASVQWAGVEIGDNVWLPNAWVNPGVKIGSNVIVAARSLIKNSLPSNCIAAGNPAKVIKEEYFPNVLSIDKKSDLINLIINQITNRYEKSLESVVFSFDIYNEILNVETPFGLTCFDLLQRKITGRVNNISLIVKDQLRRNGIRFRYFENEGHWIPW
jgi:acetyltransferase-like isoleucine patch superfamily enzyme